MKVKAYKGARWDRQAHEDRKDAAAAAKALRDEVQALKAQIRDEVILDVDAIRAEVEKLKKGNGKP